MKELLKRLFSRGRRAFWTVLVGLVCCPIFGAACLWLCQTRIAAIGACALLAIAGAIGAMASVALLTSGKDHS